MFKTSKIISFILWILFTFVQCSYASDNHLPVRVGISDTGFKTYIFDKVEFNNASALDVMDAATGYVIPISEENAQILKVTSENNLFRIYIDDVLAAKNLTGPVIVRSKDNETVAIKGLKRKGKQAAYRGYIELMRSSKDISKFSIVNILSLKNYLRGVVPNEMPVRFGLEALKAQTVAARNYAITPRIKAYDEFDLCDSVACQVYFGANTEDPLTDEAIEQTNGIIALDKENNPILALYSSTAGGYTESYEFAFSDPETRIFPSKDIHYLRAVPDNQDFTELNTDEKAEEFYLSNPEAFDDTSPYYRWSREWTMKELNEILPKTIKAQSLTGFIIPELTSESDFGNLISIKALERGKSGKIIALELKTDKNTFIIQKELVIRRCFPKNGISLPSANFIISYVNSAMPVYKFSGGGFGHGVGMSQWGAGKMASLGYTFDEILQHYYSGIKLATIPVIIRGNYKITERVFYTENENAEIFVLNPNNIKKIKVFVNNRELIIKPDKEETKVNISRYLNKGENKISYIVIDDNATYEDSAVIFIQLKGALDE